MNSWEDIARRLGKAFVEEVKAFPRVTIKEFLLSKKKVSGVYLIFDPNGECIYIGVSGNVASRLRSHLSRGNDCGLLWYVCEQRNVTVERTFGHKCKCGEFLECGRAARYIVPKTDQIKAVAVEIRATYTVLLMDGRGGYGEHLLTKILKPKYCGKDSID